MARDQSVWDGGFDACVPCTDGRDNEIEGEDDGGDAECRQDNAKRMPPDIANDQGPHRHGLVDRTFVEMKNLLCVVCGTRIVRHHEDGLVEFLMKACEERHDGLSRASIEIAGRFIRQ